jgi:hypothetical protein
VLLKGTAIYLIDFEQPFFLGKRYVSFGKELRRRLFFAHLLTLLLIYNKLLLKKLKTKKDQ